MAKIKIVKKDGLVTFTDDGTLEFAAKVMLRCWLVAFPAGVIVGGIIGFFCFNLWGRYVHITNIGAAQA